MSRRATGNSRNAHTTENEIALQWEIKRLRAKLVATRRKLGEDENGHRPGDKLRGVPRGVFLIKIARLSMKMVRDWVSPDEFCNQCGGLPWWRYEQAFYQEAAKAGFTKDTAEPAQWHEPMARRIGEASTPLSPRE